MWPAALRPASVLTSIGKKVISTITAAFDCQSKPNHMTAIGATPTIGNADTTLQAADRAAPGVRKLIELGDGSITFGPDGTVTHYPCPDLLTTNACFAGPGMRTLYATLSTSGRLIAFDNWPTAGLKLNF